MVLMNPGPVNVSERVRRALQAPDVCHREPEFGLVVAAIRRKLLHAFVPGAEDDYTAIVLTGSGTAAVEAALLSSLPQGKRMIVINNGVYGQRMSQIVAMHRLGVAELKLEWGTRPDPEKVRIALQQHPEVHAVAMVHHETSTGLVNPVREIAEVVDSQNRVFILDSVSGLGGDPLDIAGPHIYMVAGTAQKCLQGYPGVSYVLVRKGFMDRMKSYPKRSLYLSLSSYYEEQERHSVPFTPSVPVYYALNEALDELLEEGVAQRIQRFKRAATMIRRKFAEWGLRPLLPPEHQSNTLSAFYLPPGLEYQTLHDRMKDRGYVIYAGQGDLAGQIFRIANIGALTDKDIEGFLEAFHHVLTTEIAQA